MSPRSMRSMYLYSHSSSSLNLTDFLGLSPARCLPADVLEPLAGVSFFACGAVACVGVGAVGDGVDAFLPRAAANVRWKGVRLAARDEAAAEDDAAGLADFLNDGRAPEVLLAPALDARTAAADLGAGGATSAASLLTGCSTLGFVSTLSFFLASVSERRSASACGSG